jgi:hypothetical protein
LFVQVRKGDVGFDLEELEVAAELVLAEDDEVSSKIRRAMFTIDVTNY